MDKQLQQENKQLRRRLKAYVSQAYQNEEKYQRFHDQELQFISASGMIELLGIVLVDYRINFSLDVVTLSLYDPEFEIRRILDSLNLTEEERGGLVFCEETEKLQGLFRDFPRPRINCLDQECIDLLFPGSGHLVKSTASFPLLRNRQLIGVLNMGSAQEERFISGSATDFLERLSAVLAVCLENALNHERLKLLGLLDPLTGIHNRRYFDQRLEEETNRVIRNGKPLSCLFLDIDHFKQFNDRYGHHVGDVVLQRVATTIKSHMRTSDVLARFGGEEFAVLLADTGLSESLEIAERIRHTVLDQRLTVDGVALDRITVSVGCSVLPDGRGRDGSGLGPVLINNADKALYSAKSNGRNRVESLLVSN